MVTIRNAALTVGWGVPWATCADTMASACPIATTAFRTAMKGTSTAGASVITAFVAPVRKASHEANAPSGSHGFRPGCAGLGAGGAGHDARSHRGQDGARAHQGGSGDREGPACS